MRFKRIISAVDSHTEGEPARIIIGGVPPVPGTTMVEKWKWAQQNLDELRMFLMFEPRGHSAMSGSIITAPCSPEADVGVLFIEVTGFLPMCGHETIAVCTVLVETGMIQAKEPVTSVVLDTPAGLVRAQVRVEDGVARDVTFQNVPAFVARQGVQVDVPTLGPVSVDFAWGGNFYAFVSAESVGLEIAPQNVKQVVELGTKIRQAVFEQVTLVHPLFPNDAVINRVNHVRFVSPSKSADVTTRNTVFCSAEMLDRSPCGTGTSAEMALRHAKGLLRLNEEFVAESIVGSRFYGKLVGETKVGSLPAVIPTVRGSAYIMGLHQFVLDPRDPWPRGFYLGPSSQWGCQF